MGSDTMRVRNATKAVIALGFVNLRPGDVVAVPEEYQERVAKCSLARAGALVHVRPGDEEHEPPPTIEQPPRVDSLLSLVEGEAIALVQSTTDPQTLSRWTQSETRTAVRLALRDALEMALGASPPPAFDPLKGAAK